MIATLCGEHVGIEGEQQIATQVMTGCARYFWRGNRRCGSQAMSFELGLLLIRK